MTFDTHRLAERASLLRLSALSLAENMKSGNFKSVHRGQGIEFSDVREYLYGDNVRAIDWNVTARTGRAFIRQYEEDRELSVFLILDCSRSMESGPHTKTRLSTAAETAALLLLASEHNQGATGTVLFDGKILFSCEPKPGRENSMMILSMLDKIGTIPDEARTDGSALANAITGAAKLLRKRSLVFILSDFRSVGWEKPLARLAQKNDVVAVRITDRTDSELPDMGTVPFIDAETHKKAVLPTRSRRLKSEWAAADKQRTARWKDSCARHGARTVTLDTGDDALMVLSRFFRTTGA